MLISIKKRQFSVDLKKRSGQALTEMAVFGSLFLFCLTMLLQYALNLNYRQELNMVAFRRALSEANDLSQKGLSSQIVTLQDKSYPDAQDSTGVPQHYPVMAGTGVMWSNRLMSDYTDSGPNPDMPRMVMDINGRQILSNQQGVNELRTAGIRNYSFTLAQAENTSISTIKENDVQCKDFYGNPLPIWECPDLYGNNPSWRWEQRSLILETSEMSHLMASVSLAILRTKAQDIANKDIKGQQADVDSEFVRNGDSITCVSGDCKTELITSVGIGEHVEAIDSNHDRVTFYVNAITVYDYQAGDIDASYNSADEMAGRVQQGIQPGYARRITSNSAVTRQENVATNPDAIKTTISAQATDTINRTVELNNYRVNVASERPTSSVQEWVTPND